MPDVYESLKIVSADGNEAGTFCVVGQTAERVTHFCNLSRAPHMLVGGCSGSGKSVVLHGVILSLAVNYSPRELELVLVDPKDVEFTAYDGLPHVRRADLSTVEEELARRKAGEKRLVVVIDEVALLDERDRKITEKLVRDGQGGGISVVFATQRVMSDNLSRVLKAGAPTVIACHLSSKLESRALLGAAGAEKLNERGEIIYKDGSGKFVELQSFYTTGRERQELVEKIKNDTRVR